MPEPETLRGDRRAASQNGLSVRSESDCSRDSEERHNQMINRMVRDLRIHMWMLIGMEVEIVACAMLLVKLFWG